MFFFGYVKNRTGCFRRRCCEHPFKIFSWVYSWWKRKTFPLLILLKFKHFLRFSFCSFNKWNTMFFDWKSEFNLHLSILNPCLVICFMKFSLFCEIFLFCLRGSDSMFFLPGVLSLSWNCSFCGIYLTLLSTVIFCNVIYIHEIVW